MVITSTSLLLKGARPFVAITAFSKLVWLKYAPEKSRCGAEAFFLRLLPLSYGVFITVIPASLRAYEC